MNRDLFLAILAMDSYNRGYDVGIESLDESGQIGSATIREFLVDEQDGWQSAGFYALAYEWNGETIISIRGTDNLDPDTEGEWITYLEGFVGEPSPLVGDPDYTAYGLGVGQPFALTGGLTDQARLTIEFYRSVAGEGVDPFTANIALTGHSLGGGLAGYAAMLYGQQATVFANMAFEASALATRGAALVGSVVGLDTLVYGGGPIYSTDRTGINAFAVYGELLTPNRLAQSTPVHCAVFKWRGKKSYKPAFNGIAYGSSLEQYLWQSELGSCWKAAL
jgi:hypothetical protein